MCLPVSNQLPAITSDLALNAFGLHRALNALSHRSSFLFRFPFSPCLCLSNGSVHLHLFHLYLFAILTTALTSAFGHSHMLCVSAYLLFSFVFWSPKKGCIVSVLSLRTFIRHADPGRARVRFFVFVWFVFLSLLSCSINIAFRYEESCMYVLSAWHGDNLEFVV